MIKFQTIFTVLILLSTSFSCCKDDDNKPGDENENFSEYFTCKINGVEFNPTGTFNCNNLSFYYYQEETGGVPAGSMVISGRNCPTGEAVALRFEGVEPNVGFLDFNFPTYADSCFPIYRNAHIETGSTIIHYESLIVGSMNISSFTPRDSVTEKLGKIEGTFEFTVANEENDSIIHVTDGAFRFKVPNIW
ncbi:hypothetical protein G3O08_16845 [Cryomorpha ignava]|uniref:Lipocalin-like domain-containing protein n=1 Tax=Cryomorpha ignava TaxID=101383 RepID=A0A7K3WVU3_9FLAO|nr:hypothetical protein [Cryomorpha ignava]NEN25171.1 hypothetical protein [Cryomorpha ignava]